MKHLLVLVVLLGLITPRLSADEGMWLPALIQKLNIKDMQKEGFKLTAEDLYSINNGSIKDAVVSIGGCTAEIISPEGLMLTNHHCAFGDVQSLSTVEHDYLRDGFWAASKGEELPCPRKMARFLISAENVTDKVLASVKEGMTFEERQKAVSEASSKLEREATSGTNYEARISSLFESNMYFLFVYETYRDIRLVGVPPQSLGKFGGETDNWVWPRHTCDFSMYRVYSGPNGKPAAYSKDNIPLKPRRYFPVSIKGVKDGDYAMVMGYPGRTYRYRTSAEVRYIMEVTNQVRIDAREKKLEIIKKYMDTSEKARLQYANKFAGSSNYYKYSIGQNLQLKKLDVINRKKAEEEAFSKWVAASPERTAKYGKALEMISSAYANLDYENAQNYLAEALMQGPEIITISYRARGLYNMLEKPKENAVQIKQAAEDLQRQAGNFYKDYDPATDQELAASLLELYADKVKSDFYPDFYKTVFTKYKGDFVKYAAKMFESSVFANQDKLNAFLKNPTRKAMDKDLAFKAATDIFAQLGKLESEIRKKTTHLEEGRHLLLEGLMQMQPEKVFYPDANSTMRVTFGTVGSYQPQDGVIYKETTSVRGYLEKEIPGDDEFDVPAKIKTLIQAKDFGRYANKNGELETCFISNNDITGGNSGSPVINANGELIGIAFDGNWEAMSGDVAFEPALQRTISVDIRFVLWVVDKYAGATNLIKEMTIVQ